MTDDDDDVIARLEHEQERYTRIHDFVLAKRDTLRGTEAFSILNDIHHALGGRDSDVFRDAASRLRQKPLDYDAEIMPSDPPKKRFRAKLKGVR